MKPVHLFLIASTLLIPANALAFSDLIESNAHYHALTYLEDEGVVKGYSDGSVKPENSINRAELIKILVEGLNKKPGSTDKNCFPDVEEEWFAPFVCYAQKQKWVEGYADGTFRPSQNVNKVEALKIILNAFGQKTFTPVKDYFSDAPSSAW